MAGTRIGILGGGLAGLVVASKLNFEYEVLERASRCGGHCRTIIEEGFTIDAGGPHIMFSRNKEVLAYELALLAGNVRMGRRNNKIFLDGRYVKYPFENGLYALDPKDRFECLYDYLYNESPQPTNLGEWFYRAFGRGMAEKYFLPYNKKIWKLAPEKMAFSWVDGRVPEPPAEDIIRSAVGVETEGYLEQLEFYYPLRGGFEQLPKAFEKSVRQITTGFSVKHVWKEEDQWVVSDGVRERRFGTLISTIPVQELLAGLPDVPAEVRAAAAALRFNSLIVVMIGLATTGTPDFTAVYYPGEETVFHRVSFPHVFSPTNAPPGCSAIVAEITANLDDETWRKSDAGLRDLVVRGLEDVGLLHRSQILYEKVVRTRYAYPVQDFGYRKNLRICREYVDQLGIVSLGRNAEFEYINSDEAVRRGLQVAERLQQQLP